MFESLKQSGMVFISKKRFFTFAALGMMTALLLIGFFKATRTIHHQYHLLFLCGDERDGLIDAHIGGQAFSSVEALENYLKTFPRGTIISAYFGFPNGVKDKHQKASLDNVVLQQKLLAFCSKNRFYYLASIESDCFY